MIYCGIDIGSRIHEIIFVDENKKLLSKSIRFKETAEGHKKAIDLVKKYSGRQKLCIGFEATGVYYQNLISSLGALKQKISFCRFNPYAAKHYNESFLKRQLDDKICARGLAFMTVDRKDLHPAYEPEPQSDLGVLSCEIIELKKQQTALANRLHKEIFIANPEIKNVFSDVVGAQCLALLSRYPTADKLAKAKQTYVAKVRDKAPYAHAIGLKKALTLVEGARESIASDVTIQRGRKIQRLVNHIQLIKHQINECWSQMKESIGDLGSDLEPGMAFSDPETSEDKKRQDITLINSIDGIGDWGATAIVAIAGDISRFTTFEKLNAFIGTCPRYSRSGNNDKATGTMSKRGNKKIRGLLYMLALTATSQNRIVAQYYQKQLKQKKSKKKAICACMTKLLRLIYGVILTRRIFDPYYMEKRRNE